MGRYVNYAYQELSGAYDWPFQETSTSGTAPITITDLRTVESVTNSTSELKLAPMDRKFVTSEDPSLNNTGTAYWYYITNGTTVNVWPANTADTFLVRYWSVPTDLTGTQTPDLPTRWQYLIVDSAARKAYQDDDKPELAAMAEAEYQRGLVMMAAEFDGQQRDKPDQIEQTNAHEYA